MNKWTGLLLFMFVLVVLAAAGVGIYFYLHGRCTLTSPSFDATVVSWDPGAKILKVSYNKCSYPLLLEPPKTAVIIREAPKGNGTPNERMVFPQSGRLWDLAFQKGDTVKVDLMYPGEDDSPYVSRRVRNLGAGASGG